MAIGLIPIGLAFFKAKQKPQWLGMLSIPLVIAVAWVVWSQAYNARMESVYFLTTIRPIWDAIDPISNVDIFHGIDASSVVSWVRALEPLALDVLSRYLQWAVI